MDIEQGVKRLQHDDRRSRLVDNVAAAVLLGVALVDVSATGAQTAPERPQAASAERSSRLSWLHANATPVRSIDPSDQDYSDLEPLVDAIGESRIVLLGESTHGDGAAFSAKVRLIQFLHERMGFDVLTWEAGMYDMAKTEAALRAGADGGVAASLGMSPVWAGSSEVAPLFDYTVASYATQRSLHISGFDMQFRGDPSPFFADLASFVRALPGSAVRDQATVLVERVEKDYAPVVAVHLAQNDKFLALGESGIEGEELSTALAAWYEPYRDRHGPTLADLQSFERSAEALLDLVSAERSEFLVIHAPRRIDFVVRALGNLLGFAANLYEIHGRDLAVAEPDAVPLGNLGWNRRDARNADNLLWLAQSYYAGRKIIVWAHNGHIINAYYKSDWSELSLQPQPGGMKSMGVFLKEALGDEVYSVGFTAHEGTYGQVGVPNWQSPRADGTWLIEEAPAEGIANLLHELGWPSLFLDLRLRDAQPEHWLREPRLLSLRGYNLHENLDWTRVIDALFFVDVMTPGHRRGR